MISSFSKTLRAFLPLTVILGGAACAAGAYDEPLPEEKVGETEQPFMAAIGGEGMLRGHEDLTRLAIDRANTTLGHAFYPTAVPADLTPQWSNAVIRGNWETDKPSDRMRAFHSAQDMRRDWHKDKLLQNIHSLRNYPGDAVETAYDACLGTRKVIDRATKEALHWFDGRSDWYGFYFTGHATHTLQDSFSTAHTERSGAGLLQLDDVCTYGAAFAGVCSHANVDLRDSVWRVGDGCATVTSRRGYDCLKPEAKAAVDATRDYLVIVARAAEGGGNLSANMRAFYKKYLNCSVFQVLD